MTKDDLVGWHHRLSGHEFEQTLGIGDGQGSLACFSAWGGKQSDMTEQLNRTERGFCGGKHLKLFFMSESVFMLFSFVLDIFS